MCGIVGRAINTMLLLLIVVVVAGLCMAIGGYLVKLFELTYTTGEIPPSSTISNRNFWDYNLDYSLYALYAWLAFVFVVFCLVLVFHGSAALAHHCVCCMCKAILLNPMYRCCCRDRDFRRRSEEDAEYLEWRQRNAVTPAPRREPSYYALEEV
jgi:hypothetical protein